MTEQLMVIEKNCTTGEEIIRPMTADEIVAQEKNVEDFNAKEVIRLAEESVKAELRASAQAKLAALGLTAEEISALN